MNITSGQIIHFFHKLPGIAVTETKICGSLLFSSFSRALDPTAKLDLPSQSDFPNSRTPLFELEIMTTHDTRGCRPEDHVELLRPRNVEQERR